MEFKPLTGATVIDMTEGVAGPYSTMILGDLGADVIKIERPTGDWGRYLGTISNGTSTQYIALNRSKRNICVDIKEPSGQDLIKKLISNADIVVTSFRPGVTEKYGLGYEDLKKINKNLIVGRISGYGYEGEYKNYTGVDTVIQANSGVMNHIGPKDGMPYRTGFPIIDHVAARDMVQGILAAYISKLKGEKLDGAIDVSLYATAAALQAQQWQDFLTTGIPPTRSGNLNPVIAPSAVYETKDEKFISIAVVRDEQWKRLIKALNIDLKEDDDRFLTNSLRLKNRLEMENILTPTLKSYTSKELVEIFVEKDITHAEVLNMKEISESPLYHTIPKVNFEMNGENITSIGLPFTLNSKLNKKVNLPPSSKGQHSAEIVESLGYSQKEIQKMVDEKVIHIQKEGMSYAK